jgi:hypothetical protein
MPENTGDNYRENFERQLPSIEGLKEQIEQKQFEVQSELPENKEKIIKKEISEKLKEFQSNSSDVSSIPLSDRDEASEISKLSVEQQVEALVSLVFEKGLDSSVSTAKKINNPAILDSLHDILIDKYYEMLVSQGVIKI